MVKLKINVKYRSKAETTLHDLEKAATYLRDTALYLKRIATYLEETSDVETDNIISGTPESPSHLPFAPEEVPTVQKTSVLTANDIEAAFILTNMRAGNIYTSKELKAAVTLTMLQKGSSAGTGVIPVKSRSASQEHNSSDRAKSGRTLRSRPARVDKTVSLA